MFGYPSSWLHEMFGRLLRFLPNTSKPNFTKFPFLPRILIQFPYNDNVVYVSFLSSALCSSKWWIAFRGDAVWKTFMD